MRAALDEVTPSWGVQITRVAVKAIELPAGLAEAAERLLIGQAPQPIDAPQVVYNIGTVSAAGNFGRGGKVDAPTASGARSSIEIHRQTDSRAALQLVQALIAEIRANAHGDAETMLENNARIVQGEVLAAEAEKRQPDNHRIKKALAAITDFAGAGASVATTAEQIAKLFGLA